MKCDEGTCKKDDKLGECPSVPSRRQNDGVSASAARLPCHVQKVGNAQGEPDTSQGVVDG